jgi:hypothetical protein
LGYGYQWAATPKLTMIAGAGNFPQGENAWKARKQGSKKYFLGL